MLNTGTISCKKTCAQGGEVVNHDASARLDVLIKDQIIEAVAPDIKARFYICSLPATSTTASPHCASATRHAMRSRPAVHASLMPLDPMSCRVASILTRIWICRSWARLLVMISTGKKKAMLVGERAGMPRQT
jgi:hypothetical protein